MTAAAAEPAMTRDEVEQQLSDALIEIRDRAEQRRAIRNATTVAARDTG